ncbi:MAG: TolB-like translocation protein [Planctomycetota bacterium]
MNYSIHPITQPPKHHFFGYYDMRPWDRSGRYHLVLEVDFDDRPPTADDEAVVGVVDLAEGNAFRPLSRTRAWNFQQGAMLHWLATEESTVLFNDRRDERLVCVAHDVAGGSERIVGPAIGALSADGRFAATLNYARIAVTRPGYGYLGVDSPGLSENVPDSDGLGLLATGTGDHALLVSFADLTAMQEAALSYGSERVWFNHAIFSPSGARIAFLCRWRHGESWRTQMWTVGIDGHDLVRVLDGPLVSHFDWKDDETLIAWAGVDGVKAVWEFSPTGRGRPRAVFRDAIDRDGHICFSHDRRWLATDTYPDADGNRRLAVVDCRTGRRLELGTYRSPMTPGLHEIRCDFHPSWSNDDRQLAIDGMHEGTRQRYVVTLEP